MTTGIFHSNQAFRDEQTAEMIKGYLEDKTQVRSAEVIGIDNSDFLSFTQYEKIILVGGENINPLTAQAGTNRFFPRLEEEGDSFVSEYENRGVKVLVVAGFNGQDTREKAEQIINNGVLKDFGGGRDAVQEDPPSFIDIPEDEPEPESATHRARLKYEPRFGVSGGLVNFTSEDIADKLGENLPSLSGWSINRVEHKQDDNIVDVYLNKKSSISAGLVLVILVAVAGTVFVSAKWSGVQMKKLENDETQLEDVDDAKQQLKKIANSEQVSEENRQRANETLIEVLGESGTVDEDKSSNKNGGLIPNLQTSNLQIIGVLVVVFLFVSRGNGETNIY